MSRDAQNEAALSHLRQDLVERDAAVRIRLCLIHH